MAEQGSKAFGGYTGQRVSAVPEGFLSAYAQVAKNYQSVGEDVGKAVGGMIAEYRATRATEELLNQKTSSPEFMKGLGDTLTGARKKQGELLESLKKSGINPDLEDDPYDIQHPENLAALAKSPAAGEAYALLKAYDGVHTQGQAFLKDPSKFDNKKKMQLIGAVTTAVESMNAETKKATDAEAAALKARATLADIEAKEAAAGKARAPSMTPATAVRDAIGLATTMTPAQAQGKFLALQKQAQIEAEQDRQRGGQGMPTEVTVAQLLAVKEYMQSVQDPTEVSKGVPTEGSADSPFISIEAAQTRLKAIDKELEKEKGWFNPKRDLLAAQREEIQQGLSNAKQDGADKIYAPEAVGLVADERIVEINRKFNMAVALIENQNGIQTKNGKLMLPSLSVEDRKNLYRMIELGGVGIRSPEEGVMYDVDENGFLIAKPLTDDEIKTIVKRQEMGALDPKTRKAIVAADTAEMKAKANLGSREFGEFEVTTRGVAGGPEGKTETVSTVNSKRGERILHVPHRPDLNLWISGRMNTDGTPTSTNVQKFREKITSENELLNALESARDIFYYTPEQAESLGLEKGKRHRKAVLSDDDMVIYLQRLYSMKRAMGKGLGPLSRGDYQLLETNVFAQVPYSQVNFEEPNVIKQFLSREWKNLTRDPAIMEKQVTNIQADVRDRVLSLVKSGSEVWAVDDNEQRVEDGFSISHGLFTDKDGKISRSHLYLSTKDGKSEYKVFDPYTTAKGYATTTDKKRTHDEFEEVMKDQYVNNKLLREKYLFLLSALQKGKTDTSEEALRQIEIGKALLIERLEYVGMHPTLIKPYVDGIVEGL
jgi:hypothetical protein